MRSFFLSVILLHFCMLPAIGQFTDSLHVIVGTTGTIASNDYQPLWLKANRFGAITNRKADLSTHFLINNKHIISKAKAIDDFDTTNLRRPAYISYGVDLYNNNHFENTFLQEGYVKAGLKNWELRGGRYKEIVGEVDPFLSSGSLAISGNAIPIPKISIASSRYINVPYTKGWLQFKASFGHGWLGQTNYLKGAFLHEKSFYLKIGKHKFNSYAGLNHFAQWGGTHPSGQAPSRFKDYLYIIAGGKGDASYQQGPIDLANAVGNHLIIPDIGFSLQASGGMFKLYTQTIFEKGKGRSATERDRLVGLKVLSRDRLVGFSWENNKQALVQKTVFEGLFTKHQGGPVLYVGQDNYYNNATYRTGWVYQDRIIGTPLFITRNDALKFHTKIDTSGVSDYNITSNRVNGLHLGFSGYVATNVSYRMLTTYIQHYGNYNNNIFDPEKKQLHLLLEGSYQLSKAINLTAAFGLDNGDLSDNTGGSLKIEWRLR